MMVLDVSRQVRKQGRGRGVVLGEASNTHLRFAHDDFVGSLGKDGICRRRRRPTKSLLPVASTAVAGGIGDGGDVGDAIAAHRDRVALGPLLVCDRLAAVFLMLRFLVVFPLRLRSAYAAFLQPAGAGQYFESPREG